VEKPFAVAAVGMGNPHLDPVAPFFEYVDLERLGRSWEVNRPFPARAKSISWPLRSADTLGDAGGGRARPTMAAAPEPWAVAWWLPSPGLSGRGAGGSAGGTLWIRWDLQTGHLFMPGGQKPAFDGVLAPELLWPEQAQPVAAEPSLPAVVAEQPAINCSVACAFRAASTGTAPVLRPAPGRRPSLAAVRSMISFAMGSDRSIPGRPGPDWSAMSSPGLSRRLSRTPVRDAPRA